MNDYATCDAFVETQLATAMTDLAKVRDRQSLLASERDQAWFDLDFLLKGLIVSQERSELVKSIYTYPKGKEEPLGEAKAAT